MNKKGTKHKFPVGMEVMNVKTINVFKSAKYIRVQTWGNSVSDLFIPVGSKFIIEKHLELRKGLPPEYVLRSEDGVYIYWVFESLLAPATPLGATLYERV